MSTTVPQPAPVAPVKSERLVSLDAYRGFVMLLLAASAFAMTPKLMLKFYPDSPFWTAVAQQWNHVGYTIAKPSDFRIWDLIQPAFMFIVGVSVPYSYGARQARGESHLRMFGHAVYRAVVLILVGVFLRSSGHGQTNWTLEDVVSQIGLGYVFLYLLWTQRWQVQAIAAATILVAYWGLWRFWPQIAAQIGVAQAAVAGWPKAGNPGQAFDVWLRNALPHAKPFTNHAYYTLNFIPSLANMIFGLLAGQLLRSSLTARRKLLILTGTGIAGILLGIALAPFCPLIKTIWTPTFAIFSGGWCLLLLAGFYGVVDVLGWRRWTFPAVVLGANSIAVYVLMGMWWGDNGWLLGNVKRHSGTWLLSRMSDPWAAVTASVLACLIFWSIFYWMYRRKIFLRI